MAHGQPDGGDGAPKDAIYTVTDIGELAARLGSIVTFDRRGDVVWLDNFEDNLNKWAAYNVGAAGSSALSTDYARNGAKSAKLQTAAQAAAGRGLERYLSRLRNGKIGFEISFTVDTHVDYIYHYFHGVYNTAGWHGGILVYPGSGQVDIQQSGATFVTLDTLTGFPVVAGQFHTIKLVLDTSTMKYTRLLLNQDEWDISDYDLDTETVAAANRLYLDFAVYASGANAAASYLDDAIVTQNEP